MKAERVLVVDDADEIVHFIEECALRPMGLETFSANNGAVGLERALKLLPDLILVDMNMPKMTGLQMLSCLREAEYTSPVVFMTMFGSEQLAAEAFRLGVRDYIPKPFTVEQVQTVVTRALTEARLRREKEALKDELLAAETVRQTVGTLAHHTNNHLMIIEAGLRLLQESVDSGRGEIERNRRILSDCLTSVGRLESVIKELQTITRVRTIRYDSSSRLVDLEQAEGRGMSGG